MAAFMPESSNMRAIRGVSSYKFDYSNKKVVNPEDTYELPWRPPETLICIQALAEFNEYKSVYFKSGKKVKSGQMRLCQHAINLIDM